MFLFRCSFHPCDDDAVLVVQAPTLRPFQLSAAWHKHLCILQQWKAFSRKPHCQHFVSDIRYTEMDYLSSYIPVHQVRSRFAQHYRPALVFVSCLVGKVDKQTPAPHCRSTLVLPPTFATLDMSSLCSYSHLLSAAHLTLMNKCASHCRVYDRHTAYYSAARSHGRSGQVGREPGH